MYSRVEVYWVTQSKKLSPCQGEWSFLPDSLDSLRCCNGHGQAIEVVDIVLQIPISMACAYWQTLQNSDPRVLEVTTLT